MCGFFLQVFLALYSHLVYMTQLVDLAGLGCCLAAFNLQFLSSESREEVPGLHGLAQGSLVEVVLVVST